MTLAFPLLVALVAVALAFDFLNGLHDAANSIATVVSTRVLKPHYAVAWAAFFNFVAFLVFGLHVANTVGAGIISADTIDASVVFGALMGAISWNIITWVLGLPTSSSHALIGGLVGAAVVEGGVSAVNWGGIEHWRPVGVFGILIALALSPILGGVAALLLIRAARAVAHRATRRWRRPAPGRAST